MMIIGPDRKVEQSGKSIFAFRKIFAPKRSPLVQRYCTFPCNLCIHRAFFSKPLPESIHNVPAERTPRHSNSKYHASIAVTLPIRKRSLVCLDLVFIRKKGTNTINTIRTLMKKPNAIGRIEIRMVRRIRVGSCSNFIS